MNLVQDLWRDEAGLILSAEAAVVGTVAIVGVSAGVSVVAEAVNEELKEVGFAIRSLDQSYSIPGLKGCRAYTAGSSYTQPPVSESLASLCQVGEEATRTEVAADQKAQAVRLQEQLEQQNKPGQRKKKKQVQNNI